MENGALIIDNIDGGGGGSPGIERATEYKAGIARRNDTKE